MCDLFPASLLPEIFCMYVKAEGRIRRGISLILQWVFLTGPQAPWRQAAVCHSYLWLSVQVGIPSIYGGRIHVSGQSLSLPIASDSLGFPTAMAVRRSHSSSSLQISDQHTQKSHHIWEVQYLLRTSLSAIKTTIAIYSYWKLFWYSTGLHGKEREGFLPI